MQSARAIDVGAAVECPEPVAFLDGVQRHQVVAYGRRFPFPLVAGVVARAVRERKGGRLETVTSEVRHLLIGRREVLEEAAGCGTRSTTASCSTKRSRSIPSRRWTGQVAAIDDARSRLEVAVGEGFRARSNAWLIVDGSLAESRAFREGRPDARGLEESRHAPLRRAGPRDLPSTGAGPSHLGVPAIVAPVCAGVCLGDSGSGPGKGVTCCFGLVRVESAPTRTPLDRADEFSRWILAERAPVSAPDARWDRLLYGIHNVEDFLAAIVPAHR
jgi:hypothetical protein